jgi:hypothetical protein
MSETEALVAVDRSPLRIVTGYGRATVGAVAVALALVAVVIAIGVVVAFTSGLSNAAGGYIPNMDPWLKNTPLNARSYTKLENPWYAGLAGLGLLAVVGVSAAIVGRMAVNSPKSIADLARQAQEPGEELVGMSGF